MEVLFLGAGATGGYFGGRLLEAGKPVTFLVRSGRAAKLKKHGLVIKSSEGDVNISSPEFTEKPNKHYDLIVLSCKAYDLNDAIATIKPAVGPNTTIMPLLNGFHHFDSLREAFGEQKVLGSLCIIAATLDNNGRIIHLNDSHTIKYGEFSGERTARIVAIDELFSGIKCPVVSSDNIERDLWEKWVMLSTLAALTCLMRASIGEIATSPGGTDIANQMLGEALAVFQSYGHVPRQAFVESTRARTLDKNSSLTASMFRDIENGNRVEGDQILGDLIARAEQNNLKVPLLKTAYCHVKAYELRRERLLAQAT